MKTIVLAKTDMSGRKETGNWERFNGNYYPESVPAKAVKALVWLNKGTSADEDLAKAFAAREGYFVLTFPTTEKDPIGKAKLALA